MATRTLDYTGVTAAQVQALRQALAEASVAVEVLPLQDGEGGRFSAQGYEVRYGFWPATGALRVEVSGIRMFLDRAAGKVDSLVRPFLA